MKKYYSIFIFLVVLGITLFLSTTSLAQVAINPNGDSPDASAMLDIASTTKGMLIPRMTETQIMYIENPVNGLTVFNTDQSCFYFYNANADEWKEMAIGTGTITPWTCGDALVDSRDSKSYTTVQIGTQCWMAENLNIGTSIAGIYNQTDNNTIEKYCYDNNDANCTTYGGLYQWDEMMQYVTTEGTQGICPTGWHLPTDNEWKTIEMELGMSQSQADATGWRGTVEGGKMKEIGTSHWISPNSLATNASSFTALPGGYRLYNDGTFNYLGLYCDFWLSSEYSGSNAWYRGLGYDEGGVYRGGNIKTFGFSVRCLKD